MEVRCASEILRHQQINSHKIITLEALAEALSRSLDTNSPPWESVLLYRTNEFLLSRV